MNLSQSAFRFCQDRPLLGLSAGDRGVAITDTLWQPGDVITLAYMDGTATQIANFNRGIQTWMQYLNLNIQIVNNPRSAMIRVSHIPNQSWSQLGTNALNVPVSQPTLSIGWDGMDVILHEIGHAIGLGHEHQNPDNPIQWNVQVLNEVLSGPPNNWTPRMIELNLIERYAQDNIIGTRFDPESIMLYPVDPSWTLNGFSTPWNTTLSPLDIQLAQQIYKFPEGVNPTEQVVTQLDDGSTLISNMTDDPNNPIIINPTTTQNASLNGVGELLGIGFTLWAGTTIYRKIFSNDN